MRRVVEFVDRYWEEKGYAPSFDDISLFMNINKSNVHRLVHSMQDRGLVHMMPKNARTIVTTGKGQELGLSYVNSRT